MKDCRKVRVIVTLFVVLAVASCKKKEIEPALLPTPTTTGGSPLQTYSYFRTGYAVFELSQATQIDSSAIVAMFFDQPAYPNNTISGGNVSVNSFSLTPSQSNLYQYQFSFGLLNITNVLNWSASGSGTITAFTHSYLPSYPKYTGADLLPDTCHKANGLSVPISGVSNHSGVLNSVTVTLYQTSPTYIQVNRSTQGLSGTVGFSVSDLAGFDTNEDLYLSVAIYNYNSVKIGEVYRAFSCDYAYSKIIHFK